MEKNTCIFCQESYEPNNDRDKSCDSCYKNHKYDFIEILHYEDGELQSNTYKHFQKNDAEKFLLELSKGLVDVVLDFHGVLDTVEKNVKFTKSTVVCSFVGKLSKNRIQEREEIWDRIESGQIKWGCLIFKRGPFNDKNFSNNFTVDGSKAWFCSFVKPKLFIDDSWDHINSVNKVNVKTYKFGKNDDLSKILSF